MSLELSCDDIYYKCEMRAAWLEVLENRSKGLGTYGPCIFQSVDDFLAKVLSATQIRTYGYKGAVKSGKHVVVAIGDVHGDFLSMLSVLYLMELVDTVGNWIGGSRHVVLVGDWTDRDGRSMSVNTSHNMREEVDIIQYLAALHRDAFVLGGSVVVTLGNHEMAAVFSTKKDFSNYNKYMKSFVAEGWGDKQALWSPGEKMAKYIAYYCPLIAQYNNYLFMHGGITTGIVKAFMMTEDYKTGDVIADMNSALQRSLLAKNSDSPANSIQNIVFDRSLSQPSFDDPNASKACVNETSKLFEMLGLNWDKGGVVVGHTVQSKGIPLYCKGKVWRVDVGLSEAFGRRKPDSPIGGIEIQLDTETVVKRVLNYMAQGTGQKCAIVKRVSYYIDGTLVFCEEVKIAAGSKELLNRFASVTV
jgi:hypothetical protein